MEVLKNIRIVLVKTYHPGNIGAAARAMKTMGLSELYLVNPVNFPSPEAAKMAAGANVLLAQAKSVDSLYDALRDCCIVIASTARSRAYDLPELSPDECAKMLISRVQHEKAALIFGPERMGLSNKDLQMAKYRVNIPTSAEYTSLNLAAAVQTLGYEIFKHLIAQKPNNNPQRARSLPLTEEMELFYEHLETTLDETGFIIKNHPGEVMQKLRKLFNRAQLDKNELNLLRGALASVTRSIR